jgi:nitrate/nitrite transporter NarK
LGIALAIAVYFLIYSVTGDSDLFLALATGAAGGALTWGVFEIEYWFRRRTGT